MKLAAAAAAAAAGAKPAWQMDEGKSRRKGVQHHVEELLLLPFITIALAMFIPYV